MARRRADSACRDSVLDFITSELVADPISKADANRRIGNVDAFAAEVPRVRVEVVYALIEEHGWRALRLLYIGPPLQ